MKEFLDQYWIFALGFFSQGLFGARLLVQWYLSEKQGRVVSPVIFWQLSVIACFLFIIYGILRHDFVIILGQGLAYIIYIRNLQLEGAWSKMPFSFQAAAVILPLFTLAWIIASPEASTGYNFQNFIYPIVWVGATGQMLLNLRFVYQWYFAEKMKTSILPFGFWVMSAIGSVMVVVYAVNRFDPVLLFAQSLGLIASLRNIQLHYKTKAAE